MNLFFIGAIVGFALCFLIVTLFKTSEEKDKKEIKLLKKEILKEKAAINNLKVVAKKVKDEKSNITIDDLLQQLKLHSRWRLPNI